MGVSRRSYAAQRGVSEAAVRKAIANGRVLGRCRPDQRITCAPCGRIHAVPHRLKCRLPAHDQAQAAGARAGQKFGGRDHQGRCGKTSDQDRFRSDLAIKGKAKQSNLLAAGPETRSLYAPNRRPMCRERCSSRLSAGARAVTNLSAGSTAGSRTNASNLGQRLCDIVGGAGLRLSECGSGFR